MKDVDAALNRVDAFANFYALNGGHASDEAKDAITLATEVHHLRARLQQVIIERDSWKSAREDLARSNDRLQAEVERLSWNERTYFAEAERLRKDLAASEANLAALQALFDERPVPHAEQCDVTLRLKSKWAICTCGADAINARFQKERGNG